MADPKTVYLQKHCIPEMIDNLINRLVDDEPSDPKAFLVQCLTGTDGGGADDGGYCVQMAADGVDAESLIVFLDFDAQPGYKVSSKSARDVGATRVPTGGHDYTEKLISRQVTDDEISYAYTMGNDNVLGVRNFTATMRLLKATCGPMPSCFVSWRATWDEKGHLQSLELPQSVKTWVESAVTACKDENSGF
ncbi:hypothetical protein DIPPA_04739 [Diplonema papillatum]|nr:hypothetical protein DIPPA_04739 [Diplonema papillatum]